jgi:hypothetical protein
MSRVARVFAEELHDVPPHGQAVAGCCCIEVRGTDEDVRGSTVLVPCGNGSIAVFDTHTLDVGLRIVSAISEIQRVAPEGEVDIHPFHLAEVPDDSEKRKAGRGCGSPNQLVSPETCGLTTDGVSEVGKPSEKQRLLVGGQRLGYVHHAPKACHESSDPDRPSGLVTHPRSLPRLLSLCLLGVPVGSVAMRYPHFLHFKGIAEPWRLFAVTR